MVDLQGTAITGTYVNLGAHLLCLTPREDIAAANVREYHCSFRDRLTVNRQQLMPFDTTAGQVLTAWRTQGQPWFAQFQGTEKGHRHALRTLLGLQHPAWQLEAARLLVHLGEPERGVKVAPGALGKVPESAPGLRADLDEFLAQHTSSL